MAHHFQFDCDEPGLRTRKSRILRKKKEPRYQPKAQRVPVLFAREPADTTEWVEMRDVAIDDLIWQETQDIAKYYACKYYCSMIRGFESRLDPDVHRDVIAIANEWKKYRASRAC